MIQEVAQKLDKAKIVVVIAHENPDGDALGSVLAMVHMLRAKGKQAWGYRQGPLPREYRFLPGANEMLTQLPPPENPDLALLLDCHEPRRAGGQAEDYLTSGPECVIVDHHRGEVEFGAAHHVVPEYAATAEILVDLADQAGFEIDEAAATCLYTGLLTDTGSFAHANTNARVFRCAARLEEAGAVPWKINMEAYATIPKRQLLLCRALQGAEYLINGRMVLVKLGLEDLDELGCESHDVENLVEKLRAIPGVMVSIMIREREPGQVKISLRSVGDIDVAQVALTLGGGGHKNAAGIKMPGDMDQAAKKLTAMLSAQVEAA
jgi:phosphoesterase RecJ-like protein